MNRPIRQNTAAVGGGQNQLARHQKWGENNILYSSRDPLTKILSHPFEVPQGQWAMIQWVNFAPEEGYVVELFFDTGWCCTEPGGCAPYMITCGCQPSLSQCDGPNPLVITHPGKYQLRRTSANRGLSTIVYKLIPANSVPHELALGWCNTGGNDGSPVNGGGCSSC